MKDRHLLKKKIERIFSRNGQDGNQVKLFDSFSESEKANLLKFVTDEEIPIIGGFLEDGKSLLFTTDRVYVESGESIDFVDIRDIEKVNFDLSNQMQAKTKSTLENIEITTATGGNFIIEAEKGKPFFGLLNVLLFIQENNKSPNK